MVTIIGILGAVGVVGYQSYVDAVKADASVGNGDTISRALDTDFISITNDLGGPSSITQGSVSKATRCYDYIEQIVNGLNAGTMKNAYANLQALAVNMHDSANQPSNRAELNFGQIGGAEWTQPSSIGNLYKCVNTGCDSGQPDTYDTTLRCNVPYAGYNGSSYGNFTVAVGAASGAKKYLTVSGQVAETGSMQVEWCDGTRSIVPTAASGSVHVWSVTSPTPMGSSTVKIRLDTSNAIGKVSQITAQYPNSFFGSCD